MTNICGYCYKKIRWYHADNKVYYKGAIKRMHDACAWRFLLAETNRLRANGKIPKIEIPRSHYE